MNIFDYSIISFFNQFAQRSVQFDKKLASYNNSPVK